MNYQTPLLLGLLLLSSTLWGGEVYRSVDAAGNVIFSDVPPADGAKAERLEVPEAPSASRVRDAEERQRAIQRALQQVESKRKQQEKARDAQLAEARRILTEAEAQLTEAKVIKDEDRQSLASGRRRLRPEYFERIKAAEEAVAAARKHLNELRNRR